MWSTRTATACAGIRFTLPGEVVTAAAAPEDGGLPGSHALLGNYPNPFNASTHLRFALAAPADLRIAVYNVAGQRLRQLVEGPAPAGVHEVAWDGRDDSGASAASGVYVAVMEARVRAGDRARLPAEPVDGVAALGRGRS